MVHAAACGQRRTALALAELCPLPLPPPQGGGAPSACAQLVQALWSRVGEETLAATSPPGARASRSPATAAAPFSPVPAMRLPEGPVVVAAAAGAAACAAL